MTNLLSMLDIRPPALTLLLAAAAALGIAFACLTSRTQSARKRRHLPPGPEPLPIIGNLLDLPHTQEWLTWQKYVERYGDLVYLNALGNNYLLLGSQEAVTDLLEKKAHFNDRPHLNMLCDLMKLDWMLPIVPYGDAWRRGRRIMHSQLHAKAAEAYRPAQLRGARRFVGDLLAAEPTRPTDKLSDAAKAVLPHMVRYNFAHTAVHMIYGIDVRDPEMEKRFVEPPEGVLQGFSKALSPGQFLVDLIPLLKHVPSWFPGARFQRFAEEAARLGDVTRESPIAFMKAQIASGTSPSAMAAEMLRDFPNEEQLVKDSAGTIYLGGSDTTVAAVTSYFLAVVIYPEVQKRAQEELDRVIGRDRFPEFSDKSELPYLEGVMRECFRWLPVIPVNTAHVSMQDDEYRGYFIPKGTIALAFQWGLLHDPETYPESSTFSPERHLTRLSDGSWKLREDVPDPRKFAFGYGRRVCPGVNLAEQSLFAVLTTVIQTLDVLRVRDSNGHEVIPEARMSSGLLCHPLPFAYALRARDDAQHLVNMCSALAGGY